LKPTLLDAHAAIRWLMQPGKLSREQVRVVRTASKRGELLALSAITLLESAVLMSNPKKKLRASAGALFEQFGSENIFQILPISVGVAEEVASMGAGLHDPAGRAIVAIARVHGLRLVTSDRRIIDSRLVRVVE
jgi:PIN domain nuclease of toxin-antitoxin system